MFTLAWMIAGNVWVIGDLNNLGKIPDDCKNGLMGNRNLYHFCLSILVIMDVLIPIGMFAAFASTYDEKSRSICNRPLFLNRQDVLLRSGKLPSFARKTWPCCTIPVTIFSFVIFTVVFAIFAVVPNVLEPGSTRRPWDATFCNGYVSPLGSVKALIADHFAFSVAGEPEVSVVGACEASLFRGCYRCIRTLRHGEFLCR